jgi:hypothetical protein
MNDLILFNSITISIIWYVIGFIGWLLAYNSMRKSWYIKFNEEYWHSKYNITMYLMLLVIPCYLFFGPVSVLYVLFITDKKSRSLWFRIKKGVPTDIQLRDNINSKYE